MSDDQTEIIMELQKLANATIAKRDVCIAELKSALKPFADLSTYWEGDKLPLQPNLILIEPLPVLYATKALKDEDREG
jgi:hypothetical protein